MKKEDIRQEIEEYVDSIVDGIEQELMTKEGFASDAQRRAAFAQGYKAKGKKGKKEEVDIQEDGHVDVASAVRQCKTITEDAMQMLQKLQTMSPEDALPTWWTNKLAVASNNMNKMRDYLLVPSVSEEVELDEQFDFVLLDKDNKIVARASGKNAKKEMESSKRSAHLPPMRIPKNEVGKMKIVPISPRDKKDIGDMVLAIGEEVNLDERIDTGKSVFKVKIQQGNSKMFKTSEFKTSG